MEFYDNFNDKIYPCLGYCHSLQQRSSIKNNMVLLYKAKRVFCETIVGKVIFGRREKNDSLLLCNSYYS